jgi:hypothetical protein
MPNLFNFVAKVVNSNTPKIVYYARVFVSVMPSSSLSSLFARTKESSDDSSLPSQPGKALMIHEQFYDLSYFLSVYPTREDMTTSEEHIIAETEVQIYTGDLETWKKSPDRDITKYA